MNGYDREVAIPLNSLDSMVIQRSSAARQRTTLLIGSVLVFAWFVLVCLLPDPRPLAAPEIAVRALRSLIRLPDPAARAVTTIVLRGMGFGLFGILLSYTFKHWRLRWAGPVVVTLAIVRRYRAMDQLRPLSNYPSNPT